MEMNFRHGSSNNSKAVIVCFSVGFLTLLSLMFRASSSGHLPNVIAIRPADENEPITSLRVDHSKGIYGESPVEILHAKIAQHPKALVLCFHGCTHSGKDWFTLPEEGVIVRAILNAEMAVVAITSYDRQSGCWGPEDLRRVPLALESFQKKHEWAVNKPIFTIGASSGGSFVTMLQSKLAAQGIYVQIGRPMHGAVETWLKPFPRTIHMLYMTRDSDLRLAYEHFLSGAADSAPMKILLQTGPCSITPDRLVSRVYDLTIDLAKNVLNEFRKRGIVDENYQPLERTIRSIATELPNKEMFFAIQEEVKVCYAEHELTSEHFTEVVLRDWTEIIKKMASG